MWARDLALGKGSAKMLGKESKCLSKKTANPPKPYIENLSLASQIFCLKNVGFFRPIIGRGSP